MPGAARLSVVRGCIEAAGPEWSHRAFKEGQVIFTEQSGKTPCSQARKLLSDSSLFSYVYPSLPHRPEKQSVSVLRWADCPQEVTKLVPEMGTNTFFKKVFVLEYCHRD